jgi:hypothetical protein
MLVIVTEDESRVEDDNAEVRARLANSVTWIPKENQRVIIAVGSPSQWHSSQPLPAEAVTTELMGAASNEPDTARQFWAHFLSYLVTTAEQRGWRRFLNLTLTNRVLVKVELKDAVVKQAVISAIKGSPYGRKFRIL